MFQHDRSEVATKTMSWDGWPAVVHNTAVSWSRGRSDANRHWDIALGSNLHTMPAILHPTWTNSLWLQRICPHPATTWGLARYFCCLVGWVELYCGKDAWFYGKLPIWGRKHNAGQLNEIKNCLKIFFLPVFTSELKKIADPNFCSTYTKLLKC